MAQEFRVPTTLSEDPSSIPSIYIRQFATVSNPRSRESYTLFGLWQYSPYVAHTDTYEHINTNKYEKTNSFLCPSLL